MPRVVFEQPFYFEGHLFDAFEEYEVPDAITLPSSTRLLKEGEVYDPVTNEIEEPKTLSEMDPLEFLATKG